MSRIVALRDAIMASIRTNIPEIEHVDWHDGAFDDADIEELSFRTPAAYVTILAVPADVHLMTGEMNADVRVFVNLVTSDEGKIEERGSDPEVWTLMERLATLANLNTFTCPFVAPANGVRFKRLRDPHLRRQGVAVGVVEWNSGVKIGRNTFVERNFPLGPNTTLRQANLATTASAAIRSGGEIEVSETPGIDPGASEVPVDQNAWRVPPWEQG